MIIICVKLVNQVESCTHTSHIHTQSVMCFLEIANNSTSVHPGKCGGSLFVWPQQRERQWLQKNFLMTQGLWATKLTNTRELWDFSSTLTAAMCACVSLPLYLWMYSTPSRSDIYSGTWKSSQRFELEHRGQIRSSGCLCPLPQMSPAGSRCSTYWWHQPRGLKVGEGLGCSLIALWLAPQGPQAEAWGKVVGVFRSRCTLGTHRLTRL